MGSETMTRERPILFSGPMVRAILDGTKTQTRRVVKLRSSADVLIPDHGPKRNVSHIEQCWLANSGHYFCPYGAPGDRLWVREAWQEVHPLQVADGRYSQEGRAGIPGPPGVSYRTIYRADGPYPRIHFQQGEQRHPWRDVCSGADCARNHTHPEESRDGWRPSIHMPRWASRLTLQVTDVRVERVQDISEEDARAEGVERHWDEGVWYYGPFDHGHASATVEYERLWDSINAKRGHSWDTNPWVWVVSFEKVP